ncbi:MAG: nitroreductase family protein, partial [Betaproteobacteria bacterium]|nr:nitroreductase family protein [Betaproteobacteria bacterium]
MVDGWYVGENPKEFPPGPMERLVYYARLAPSAQNSQPWKFVAGNAEIDVFADEERALPAADSDRRELHISLGCAIEALRIAADYGGWGSDLAYFPVSHDPSLVARVRFALAGPKRDGS